MDQNAPLRDRAFRGLALLIAAIAVISGIGALNGWTLIVTETSRAIATTNSLADSSGPAITRARA